MSSPLMRKILLLLCALTIAGPLKAADPNGGAFQLPNLFVLDDPSVFLQVPTAEGDPLKHLGGAVNNFNSVEREFKQYNFAGGEISPLTQSRLNALSYLELCQKLKRANFELLERLLGLFLSTALGTAPQSELNLATPLNLYHTKQRWLMNLRKEYLSPNLQEWLTRAVPQLAAWEPYLSHLQPMVDKLFGGLIALSADNGDEEPEHRELPVEILRRLLTTRLVWEEYFSCLALLLDAPFRQPDHGYAPELVKMYETGIVELVRQIIEVGKVYKQLGTWLKEQVSAMRRNLGSKFLSTLLKCVALLEEGCAEGRVTDQRMGKSTTLRSMAGLDPQLVAEIMPLVDLIESQKLSQALKAILASNRRCLKRQFLGGEGSPEKKHYTGMVV